MKGNKKRKEKKKEKSSGTKTKILTEYQKGKDSKQNTDVSIKPKL